MCNYLNCMHAKNTRVKKSEIENFISKANIASQ